MKRPAAGVVLLSLLIATGPGGASSQPRGDVILAERMDLLQLYNKYQQHLTPQERASLIPFTPLRVVKDHDLLGDGFTPCVDVEIGGAPFYLVGGVEDAGRAGFLETYHNAVLFNDTIEVLRARALTLASVARPTSIPVLKGERFLRLFQEGKRTYVRRVGLPVLYGWIALAAGSGRDWQVLVPTASAGTGLSPEVLDRIRAHLGETNEVLRKLFAFFNARTGEQKPSPHWELEGADDDVRCVLYNGRGESFQQSTQYLVRDLEDILLGTGYNAIASPGRIDFRKGGEADR